MRYQVYWRHLLIGVTSLLVLSACFEPTDGSNQGGATASSEYSEVVFPGAVEARNTITGIEVRWNSAGDSAQGYKIYRVNGKNLNLLATVAGSATSYIDGTVFWGQVYSYRVKMVDSKGLEDKNTKTISSLSWQGLTEVTAESRTSIRVKMIPTPAVSEVRVYIEPQGVSLTGKTLAVTLTASESEYLIENLRVGYKYKVSAQAYVKSLDKEDGNTLTVDVATKTEGYDYDGLLERAYQNVLNVRAFGPSPAAPVSPTNADRTPKSTDPVVEIIWKPFRGHNSATTKYILVRAKEGNSLETSTTEACEVTTETSCRMDCPQGFYSGSVYPYCKDTKVQKSPARYHYAVALVHKDSTSGEEWVEPLPTENPERFKILVPIPPDNMVLVQRDAANHEMCKLMGSTSDPANHNRCSYYGIAGVPYSTGPNKPTLTFDPNIYDFGYNLFVDRFEAGCNWTSQAEGGMCGAGASPGDCIGKDIPANDQGLPGQVFYKVHNYDDAVPTGGCYIKDQTTWLRTNQNASYHPELKKVYINAPGSGSKIHPPLMAGVETGTAICGAVVDPYYGPRRLPRLREKQVFLAWPTDTEDLYYQPNWKNLERPPGDGGTVPSSCLTDYTQTAIYPPATWPRTVADLLVSGNEAAELWGPDAIAESSRRQTRKYVIGSSRSADCQSRYGVQDGIGNMYELVSDVFVSKPSTNVKSNSDTYVSPVDNGNRDLRGVRMDGVFGLGGASGAGGKFFTNSIITSVVAPLGLPLMSTSSAYTAKTAIDFNSDVVEIVRSSNTNQSPYSSLIVYGGSMEVGSQAGRWYLQSAIWDGSYIYSTPLGFRCVLPAE
jgi:hypothetical protein